MEQSKITTFLTDLGLNPNESAVYYAALNLGPATIQQIASAAGIKRTTVYYVVESLKQKGLITLEIKGFKKKFVAENPEKLEVMLETRRLQLKNMLPELSALYNIKGGESFIKYYEGLKAVESIYEGLIRDIKPHEDYLILSDVEKWYDLDRDFFKKFLDKRAKLPIKVRLLIRDSAYAKKFYKHLRPNERLKFLSPETNLTTNLVFTPQRLMIHQLTPPILAIVIENKNVIQMHREMYEIMWKSI